MQKYSLKLFVLALSIALMTVPVAAGAAALSDEFTRTVNAGRPINNRVVL